MPNLNDPDLEAISFRKGGMVHEGQVHLAGTWAYVNKEMAAWDEDRQVEELGDIYFSKGIRRGFTPASETYLAAAYQRRIQADMQATDRARRASAEIDGVPVQEQPVPPPPPDPNAPPPRVVTGGPSETVTPLTEEQRAAIVGGGAPPEDDESDAGEPDVADDSPATSEPFPGAAKANIEQTRIALSTATDAEIAKFIEWENARIDREPRKTLLDELGAGAKE